jgi:hypothetical protein
VERELDFPEGWTFDTAPCPCARVPFIRHVHVCESCGRLMPNETPPTDGGASIGPLGYYLISSGLCERCEMHDQARRAGEPWRHEALECGDVLREAFENTRNSRNSRNS